MATVKIILTDERNNLNLSMESEPGFPGPAAENQDLTNAQFIALEAVHKITDALKHRLDADDDDAADYDDDYDDYEADYEDED